MKDQKSHRLDLKSTRNLELPRGSLVDFVELADGSFSCVVEDVLARPDGGLYGGASLAMAVSLAEGTVGRPCRWMAVQHVEPAPLGATLRMELTRLTSGRSVSQVVLRALEGERTVFSAIGALGDDRGDENSQQLLPAPAVAPPRECEHYEVPGADAYPQRNMFRLLEVRIAKPKSPDVSDDLVRLWVRARGLSAAAPTVAYVSDWLAPGVWRALGRPGTAISLDTTLRVAGRDESEWMLIEVRAQISAGGYASGQIPVWSESGRLLGIASQTAVLRPFRSKRRDAGGPS